MKRNASEGVLVTRASGGERDEAGDEGRSRAVDEIDGLHSFDRNAHRKRGGGYSTDDGCDSDSSNDLFHDVNAQAPGRHDRIEDKHSTAFGNTGGPRVVSGAGVRVRSSYPTQQTSKPLSGGQLSPPAPALQTSLFSPDDARLARADNSFASTSAGGGHHRPHSSLEKVKVLTRGGRSKTPPHFNALYRLQLFRAHTGSIWSMKFSADGTLLATGGQDGRVVVWLVCMDAMVPDEAPAPEVRAFGGDSSAGGWVSRSLGKDAMLEIDQTMAERQIRADITLAKLQMRNSRSHHRRRSVDALHPRRNTRLKNQPSRGSVSVDLQSKGSASFSGGSLGHDHAPARQFLLEQPYRVMRGHRADVLEISWSKNNFVLTASMDRTVRLWHPSKSACLLKFTHPDFVSCVSFHPHDENVFLSGSVDGVVRLWSIPTRTVLSSARVGDIVTALTLRRAGRLAVVGTFQGHCLFFNMYDRNTAEWRLQLVSRVDVRARRSLRRHNTRVLGVDLLPVCEDWFLVSTNDSLLRLFRMDVMKPVSEFRGHNSTGSRLKASISPNGKFVLCGSENSTTVYIWNTGVSSSSLSPEPRADQLDVKGGANQSAAGNAAGEGGSYPQAPTAASMEDLTVSGGLVKSCETFLAFPTASASVSSSGTSNENSRNNRYSGLSSNVDHSQRNSASSTEAAKSSASSSPAELSCVTFAPHIHRARAGTTSPRESTTAGLLVLAASTSGQITVFENMS
eukprot:CAMPEP_0185848120 /NCGR_PEP_ID=MMETSP1354-20130828/3115_1 /TAXON_ID=708628 /ORGANISM="Erythrolobus madagascarensis, Strain CCMP3276" /LENGTH=735 /DNA_ID=CAMNT_0028548475 /DNA_START=59 /DNA_END=2266 /DNA_ORIENTATION=+